MYPAIIITVAGGLGLIFGLLGGFMASIPSVKLPPKKVPIVLDLEQPSEKVPKTEEDFTQVANELDAWRRELSEKRNQALQYDAELLKREQVMKAEREALNRERQRVMGLQKEVEDRLIKIKGTEEPKLQELADLYKTMKPEDAAQLIKNQDPEQAAKVLSKMSAKVQAKLLTAMLKTAISAEEKRAVSDLILMLKRVMPDDGKPAPDGEAAVPQP
jgi:flagellar motility protein MotE (MotC chaperone)